MGLVQCSSLRTDLLTTPYMGSGETRHYEFVDAAVLAEEIANEGHEPLSLLLIDWDQFLALFPFQCLP